MSVDWNKPLQVLDGETWCNVLFHDPDSGNGKFPHAMVWRGPGGKIEARTFNEDGFGWGPCWNDGEVAVRNTPEKRTAPEFWMCYIGSVAYRYTFKPTELNIKNQRIETILHYPAREYEVGEGLS